MIIDKTQNLLFYKKMVPNLENGWRRLQDLGEVKEGTHVFDGGYLMIQKGGTRPLGEGTFEAHRKYADVQIMLSGCEEMAWSPLSELKTASIYNEEKDVERLEGKPLHHILVSEGMFYIAFPHDGHKAVSHVSEKHVYTKCVMKLLV